MTEKKPIADIPDLDEEIWEVANDFVYRSLVQLPMNCPLKGSISVSKLHRVASGGHVCVHHFLFQGQWMPTKRIGDKSAALETVKELHKVGELNHHLLPISKAMDVSDSEENESAGVERKNKRQGTAKNASYYPNKVVNFELSKT